MIRIAKIKVKVKINNLNKFLIMIMDNSNNSHHNFKKNLNIRQMEIKIYQIKKLNLIRNNNGNSKIHQIILIILTKINSKLMLFRKIKK